jgi:tRNA U34 5-carboxymethylaminomethyl modifying GTPase MnmE/TrmE
LNGDEHFVIVKLVTGEQVMAILEYESDNAVELVYPMLIRLFPTFVDGKAHEHVTATPYSQFAENAHISIEKRNIIFLKNLHHMLIPHFERLVAENEKTVLVNKNLDGEVKRAEDLTWEEEEYLNQVREEAQSMSTEELQKRISMLESIFGKSEQEEVIEEKNFVEGNDTLH